MRALVTGGAGFLGRHIVDQLVAAGHSVRCLVRGDHNLPHSDVECVRGDLRDANTTHAACSGIDAVFHVGGAAGIWGKWSHYFENNVLATRYVIEGCRKFSVPKLVYTSSPSVTFDGRAQENADERVGYARRFLCHYAHTKALAEQEVLAATGRHLSTCALRPHAIWGPGDRHLVPRIISRARAGRLRRIGDGTTLIDMAYVEDAARAHLQAAEALSVDSCLAGQAYFISQGEPVNCWQWIDEVLVMVGLQPVQKAISLKTAWLTGALLETIYGTLPIKSEPPMTRYVALLLGTSHYYSVSRARSDFGYEPIVSQAEGMRRLANSIHSDRFVIT